MALHLHKRGWQRMDVSILVIVVAIVMTILLTLLTDSTLIPYTLSGLTLIRDNDSRMKSWGDSSKMIFGWYDMREYNRASDNSFEIILWNNNSFDIRYGALDIINHDVLIGEVGSKKITHILITTMMNVILAQLIVLVVITTDWNNSDKNTNLENGGSLYGSGSGNGLDCSNPLNDSSCSGYADALLTQQCNITQSL